MYQKIEREVDVLTVEQREELKVFIFQQLTLQHYSLPTVRKLASAGALIAASLYLDNWPTFITDLVTFMNISALQLRNGMIVL